MLLSVFGDESADETQQRVFAVAGVFGPDVLWEDLEAKWLARTEGIPFHACDCESRQGAYANRDHRANLSLYRDLTSLLVESGLQGNGIAIDLASHRRFFPGVPPEMSYYKDFMEVTTAITDLAVASGHTVRFTFDMRRESEYNTAYLYDLMRNMPTWGRHTFSSIAFECSREHPKLQIADLLTRETMKALDNMVGPVKRPRRKSKEALDKSGRFDIYGLGEEYFASMYAKFPMIEARTGMSAEEFAVWLGENSLVDNISNRFRYIQRCTKRDAG